MTLRLAQALLHLGTRHDGMPLSPLLERGSAEPDAIAEAILQLRYYMLHGAERIDLQGCSSHYLIALTVVAAVVDSGVAVETAGAPSVWRFIWELSSQPRGSMGFRREDSTGVKDRSAE